MDGVRVRVRVRVRGMVIIRIRIRMRLPVANKRSTGYLTKVGTLHTTHPFA